MSKRSAGLLMYRRDGDDAEVFLVHPGGPFWAKKDLGAWSIPKGEYAEDEPALDAARREFQEETGFVAHGNFIALDSVRQKSGKVLSVWAFQGDCNPSNLISNRCQIEWPPHSGLLIEIPEADRGEWFSIAAAKERILKGQLPFIDKLSKRLNLPK